MNNYEWLKSLSIEDMAQVLCTNPCEMCFYDPECQGKTCDEGVIKWLNSEHGNPMPTLEKEGR